MPDTTPVDAPAVATLPSPELHVPPPVASLSVVVAPGHTLNVPVMAAGTGLTVTVVVVKQPVGRI